MSDTVQFVDWARSISGGTAGNILLDINDGTDYCVDELEFPPAAPRYEYRDPAHGDGRDVSRYKYENRILTLHMHVFGTSEDDLAVNIRALWDQLLNDSPIIEWLADGWTDPLYFDCLSPPNEINPPDWFATWIRDSGNPHVLANLELVIECKPFLRGAQTDLPILWNLGLNDSFERRSASDFENWTESNTGLGSAPAANTTAGQFLDGAVSCQLQTGAGASTSVITDTDFIAVDETHHYALQCFCYKVSGAPTLDIDLLCYDSAGTLLGTLYPLVAYAGIATTWIEALELGGSGVIYPSTSGLAMKFPTGTTKVKRVIRQDAGAAGVMTVDKLFFGDTEFIADYKPSGAIGLVIPPEHIEGDVPALADFYFSNPYSPSPFTVQTSIFSGTVRGIYALDTSHVWAVGDWGEVGFYNGATWVLATVAPVGALTSVDGVDSTHVWAVGSAAAGGASYFWNGAAWAHTTVAAGEIFYGVTVVDATHVWACGTSGVIYFYNGAWASEASGTTEYLRGIASLDANHVWAVGDAGTILFKHNGGAWASQVSGTTEDLYGIYVLDATHIWAVGDNGTILFTADAGTTWTPQISGSTQLLTGVYAASTTVAWASGVSFSVLATTNGGTTWFAQNSGTVHGTQSITGLSTTNVWATSFRTVQHGITTLSPINTTNVILGQRDKYSASYSPVKDAVGATLTNLYTCRNQKYRLMANTGTLFEEFAFNIAAHEGRYVPSANLSWAAATTKDNAIVYYKLQTLAGVDITTDTQTDTVDANNPTAKWHEVALLSWVPQARWNVINVPSFQIGDSASKGNINQIIKVIQDALDDQDEWLDYAAIIPIDRSYVEVDDWTANCLVIDSSMGLVLASLDGSQDTAQVYTRTKVKGFPQFEADPDGMNLTLLTLQEVAGDQRAYQFCNVVMRYSPLFLLVPSG